jgi:glycosyltransferase involved in cell wall biosynthesis
MRVGVYLGRHVGAGGGLGVYATELVQGILELLSEHGYQDDEVVLYGDKSIFTEKLLSDISFSSVLSKQTSGTLSSRADAYTKPFTNGSRVRLIVRHLPSFSERHLAMVCDQLLLPFWAKLDKLSVLHSVANYAICLAPVTQVVTVHDLYQAFPPAEFTAKNARARIRSQLARIFYKALFSVQFKKIAHVITDVPSVAKDVSVKYQFDLSATSVIELGLDSSFLKYQHTFEAPQWRAKAVYRFLSDHDLLSPYSVCFYSNDPRKNTERVFETWALFQKSKEGASARLAIIGANKREKKKIQLHLTERGIPGHLIVFLPWLSREELGFLFDGATSLLVPSIAEGFGFPALEAASLSTHVISSELEWMKSFPKKDLFSLVNPKDTPSILAALKKLFESAPTRPRTLEELTENFKKKPLLQVRTMKQATKETFSIYKQAHVRYGSKG